MASYATVTQLRNILTQVPAGVANDALLQDALDKATAVVDGAMGFPEGLGFTAYGVTATDKDIRAAGGLYLTLPHYSAGSVTGVTEVTNRGMPYESEDDVDDYLKEEDVRPYRLYRDLGWTRGAWYRVTAKWGYGPVPEAIELVTLEIAVNIWGAKDSRQITDVVGVEGGGAVGYNRALTNRQREAIAAARIQLGWLGNA